jgi:N,N'-diacetyllegionaminate synthase
MRSMSMKIADRRVGADAPLFVIAEIGLNHGGVLSEALALVDAAAAAGASAVKLQSLRGDTLVTAACPAPAHVESASLRDFFRQFELDEAAHAAVAGRARSLGLAFMSTPFDEAAVAMLERVGCDAYKIASGDLTHHRLIERAAATGKPLVMSTGMSDLAEAHDAVALARRAGASSIALLHCVSAYPVPRGSENLRAIATLAVELGLPTGLSDHGTDDGDIIAAVALGAVLYERHIVLEVNSSAIDAAVSSTGPQLEWRIRAAARTRAALGDGRKVCLTSEALNVAASRRALYATRDLEPGDAVRAEDIVALRPAAGLAASRWHELVGCRLQRAIPSGTPFALQDLDLAAIAGREARDAA